MQKVIINNKTEGLVICRGVRLPEGKTELNKNIWEAIKHFLKEEHFEVEQPKPKLKAQPKLKLKKEEDKK